MRVEKIAIAEEIQKKVASSSFLILADHRGLRVDQVNDLRTQLRKTGAELHAVKNRLLRLTTDQKQWTRVRDHLRGPTAMVTGSDVIETAKVIRKFNAENNALPAIKGGMLGDRYLTPDDVEALTKLPTRIVLLGQLVGTIAAPLSGLVGVMKQKVATVVYVLKAVEEHKQKSAAGA